MVDLNDYDVEPDLARASTIPSRWYTDPAFLDLEKQEIFWRTWQPVGRMDLLERAGDYLTCDVLGEPFVLTRGADGVLRGLSNVCRHRAGPVAAGKGNRKS